MLGTNQAIAVKTSLITVGAQAIVDSYLSLINLIAGIVLEVRLEYAESRSPHIAFSASKHKALELLRLVRLTIAIGCSLNFVAVRPPRPAHPPRPLQPLFSIFATAAFLKLVIFSIFEMRLLLMIWKARRPQAFADGWRRVRRELGVLYARFYCTMLLGILIAYQCWSVAPVLAFVAFSFWVPQVRLPDDETQLI